MMLPTTLATEHASSLPLDSNENRAQNENDEEEDRKRPAIETSVVLDIEELTPLDGAELHDDHTHTEESNVDIDAAAAASSNNVKNQASTTTTKDDSPSKRSSPENKSPILNMDLDAPASHFHETTILEEQKQQPPQRPTAPLQLHHRLFAKKRKIETSSKQKAPPNSDLPDTVATAAIAVPSLAAAPEESGECKRSSLKSTTTASDYQSSSSSRQVNTEEEKKIPRGSIMYKVLERLNRLDPRFVQEEDQDESQNEKSPNMDSALMADNASKPTDAEGSGANANNKSATSESQPPAPVDQLKRTPANRIAYRSTVMPQRSKQIPKESHRIVITHGVHKGKTGTEFILQKNLFLPCMGCLPHGFFFSKGFVIAEHDGRCSVIDVDEDFTRQITVKNSCIATLSAYLVRNASTAKKKMNDGKTTDDIFAECLEKQLESRSSV
jgi:hypothetical protein